MLSGKYSSCGKIVWVEECRELVSLCEVLLLTATVYTLKLKF